jgi:hypothetical protein
VPSELWGVIDMRTRLGSDWNFSNLTKMLNKICNQTGVKYEVILSLEIREESSINENDFWWGIIRRTFNEM